MQELAMVIIWLIALILMGLLLMVILASLISGVLLVIVAIEFMIRQISSRQSEEESSGLTSENE